MFSFELDFFPRAEDRGAEWHEFDGALESLLADLWRDSNIVFDWHILELEGRVQARVLAPEEAALDRANFSPVALASLARVEAMSRRPPQFHVVPEVKREEEWCACAEPSCYILFAALRGSDALSPLECGDCGRPIPLYRVPFVDNTGMEVKEAHWTLQAWAQTYRAFDWLFLHSGTGERFAYQQLSSPWSGLVREGRRIALQLEQKMGKPFYVFLQQWHERWGDDCPLCGRRWRLEESWSTRYAFKCEHSRLVAEESYTDPTPLRELHP